MLLLVDLDGVVYRGGNPVPGVADVLKRRAAAGDRVIYVTNNSSAHRTEYGARLARIGAPLLPDAESSIITAARTAAVLLSETDPAPRVVMVIGGPGLEQELRDAGLRVVAPTLRGLAAAPDALVVGVDTRLSYARLSDAAECVRRGARFWATNRDAVFPAEERLMAGAGSIVDAVATAAGREPDMVVGKPEPTLFMAGAKLAGVPVASAVAIGDNLRTDIGAANRVGARSVLMLTGVTTMAEAVAAPTELRPTRIAADAAELERALEELA